MDQLLEINKQKDNALSFCEEDLILAVLVAKEGNNGKLGRLLKEVGTFGELVTSPFLTEEGKGKDLFSYSLPKKGRDPLYTFLTDMAKQLETGSYQLPEEVFRLKEACLKEGIALVYLTENAYPPLLKMIPDPPAVLFYKGDLQKASMPGISVVGARKAGEYGKRCAYEIALALSEKKIPIVSGLAFGIDRCAHMGSLDGKGIPAAVLPTGLDDCYPKAHQWLFRRIEEEGVLFSEYPPRSTFMKAHFVERNRLVSGLSFATIVVEAGPKSGSVITAQYAADQGRDVFVVPGSLFDLSFLGSHNLIRDGANILTGIHEILGFALSQEACQMSLVMDEMPSRIGHKVTFMKRPLSQNQKEVSAEKLLDQVASKRAKAGGSLWLYDQLDDFGQSVDDLAKITKRGVGEVQTALTLLEIQGLVRRMGPLVLKC